MYVYVCVLRYPLHLNMKSTINYAQCNVQPISAERHWQKIIPRLLLAMFPIKPVIQTHTHTHHMNTAAAYKSTYSKIRWLQIYSSYCTHYMHSILKQFMWKCLPSQLSSRHAYIPPTHTHTLFMFASFPSTTRLPTRQILTCITHYKNRTMRVLPKNICFS